MALSSAQHLRGRLQHLVGRGDDLGVHLVGALRGDQVGDFLHGLDVRLFEIALLQVAEAVRSGMPFCGAPEAGVSRYRLSPMACRPALLTNSASSIWPTTSASSARQRHRDLALRVDGDRRGVLRDGEAGLQHVALRGDDAALRVELERAVARIGGAAVGQRDLEEAFAADRDVESLSVGSSLPWVIMRGVPTVFTPEPSSTPAGRMLPWSEVCVPTRRTCS